MDRRSLVEETVNALLSGDLPGYLVKKYQEALKIYREEIDPMISLCGDPEIVLAYIDEPWDIRVEPRRKIIVVNLHGVEYYIERNKYLLEKDLVDKASNAVWEPVTAFIHELVEYALLVCVDGEVYENPEYRMIVHNIARAIENGFRWKLYRLEPFP